MMMFISLGMSELSAQELRLEALSSVNVSKLSDEQIRAYWEKAQSQGYSLSDLETAARLKGVPEMQITQLKQRILQLPAVAPKAGKSNLTKNKEENTQNAVQQRDMLLFPQKKSDVFGFNFFQNSKISFTPSANMPTPETYVLGVGDELLIEVWGAAENTFSQKIDNQGNINIPSVGKIRVGGLTFQQAKSRINTALRRVYAGISAPDNSYNKVYTGVSVAEVRTVQVNIIGEVNAPGTYSLSALSTVLNALYACGGPSETGSFRNVQLIRGGQKVATFDVYDFLLNGSQNGNLTLNDQDVIIVPTYQSQVQVSGSVKRQGIYEMLPNETLADLIRYFGGFKPNAYRDNLVIERIVGAKREVQEVAYSAVQGFVMKSGDNLTVHELSDVYQNRISIGGAVYQPGNYAYTEGITAFDLIQRAAGVQDDAYLKRGIIFRTKNRVDKESIDFSVTDLLEKKQNIVLQPNDSLHVFSQKDITEKEVVRIEGAVRNPQTIPFVKGLKVEDLIVMSGGFQQGADPTTIHVSRQLNDEKFKNISEIYEVSLSEDLKISANSVELQPNDVVTVRYKKGFSPQQVVKVEGEVAYPGFYSITNKEERISDLIQRAGGLSPYAYPEGATLIRKGKASTESQLSQRIEELGETIEGKIEQHSKEEEFRVGINLVKIMNKKEQYQDLYLKEGDVLLIPSQKQTVEVRGQVLAPSLIRYKGGKSLRSYVNNAGGFANNAQKRSVYVMYANGKIEGTKNFLFFKSYPKIEPGAVIIVPEKPERKGLSTTETVSITTALTTLAILIYNTFK